MTRISDIPEELRPIQQPGKKKAQTVEKDLFKKTFDEALSKSSETSTASMPKQSLPPLGGVNAMNFSEIESLETDLDGKTYKLLEKLDQYRQKLGNPKITLKEIEPLISLINKDAEKLSDEISKSGDKNPEIKKIAGESALAANSEYIKFMRGDYLS